MQALSKRKLHKTRNSNNYTKHKLFDKLHHLKVIRQRQPIRPEKVDDVTKQLSISVDENSSLGIEFRLDDASPKAAQKRVGIFGQSLGGGRVNDAADVQFDRVFPSVTPQSANQRSNLIEVGLDFQRI